MRVITRHSKLLYFLKHLPRWQFLVLSGIVTAEAAIQGLWASVHGRREEVRAWRAIGEMASRLRRGVPLRGRGVLALAESIAAPESDGASAPGAASRSGATVPVKTRTESVRSARRRRGARQSGATLLEPRKDGSA